VLAVLAFWRATGPLGASPAQLRLLPGGATGSPVASFVEATRARAERAVPDAPPARSARALLRPRGGAWCATGKFLGARWSAASLAASDLQFFASTHPARTPKGLRLVQIDTEYQIVRAERARPELVAFDASAFGDARLRPAYPVAASIALGEIALPRIRYLVRPDVLAFEGTEAVS
jgi:hypothetical protein